MSYIDRRDDMVAESAVVNPVVDYHDRVRWGPIIAGIVIAIATQLILSALGAAIGFSARAANGWAVGIWAIVSLLISLFLGGWVMARTCGPMNSKTALLNGAILWATTLAVSSWLLASGVTGAFGAVAANAGEVLNQVQQPGGVELPNQAPNINEAQVAANAARASWSFIIGSLLGLAAAMIGASVGARKPRRHTA
ncbi:MAG: hypothetical protein KME06_13775 [Kastovskya adunca ATA6-11-RM4]|jgi:hypothetical protein|nr:hypothetical protein [Kastovskya adunca ATA6-11-RM4]